MAESFGSDPARYDRARPGYPRALVEAVVAASPGRDVLDVGCGTGIAARQFQAAGCRVLGVDIDGRMAAFAREHGIEVEVAAEGIRTTAEFRDHGAGASTGSAATRANSGSTWSQAAVMRAGSRPPSWRTCAPECGRRSMRWAAA
jgi:SAM-dependent methyltransferase